MWAFLAILVYMFCPSTEQYDTFVKFTHDQVERRLAESAFSCELLFSFNPSFLSLFTHPLFLSLPLCIFEFLVA